MTPFYDEAGVTIYHGDCRDVLPTLGRFDVVVTDPPYGVDFAGKATKHTSSSGVGYALIEDSPEYVATVVVPVIQSLTLHGARMVVTPGLRNAWAYPVPAAMGTIFYPSGSGNGRWGFTCSQPILYYGADPRLARGMGSTPDSFSTTAAAEVNGHPCPKPLWTMDWLVRKASLPGETVLDPFMGSGTTLVACKRLGRKAIGIELNEAYCEIAADRLRQGALPLEFSA